MDWPQASETELCSDLGEHSREKKQKRRLWTEFKLWMFLVQRQRVKGSGRNVTSKEQAAESLIVQNKPRKNGHQEMKPCEGRIARLLGSDQRQKICVFSTRQQKSLVCWGTTFRPWPG